VVQLPAGALWARTLSMQPHVQTLRMWISRSFLSYDSIRFLVGIMRWRLVLGIVSGVAEARVRRRLPSHASSANAYSKACRRTPRIATSTSSPSTSLPSKRRKRERRIISTKSGTPT
jgi:hypothetical protein